MNFEMILNTNLTELSDIPEFFLAFTAIVAIMHYSLIAYNKTIAGELNQLPMRSLPILILGLTLLLYLHEKDVTLKYLSFEFSFLNDSLGFLAKIITIVASLSCLYLLQDYIIEYNINNTEYDLLMLYAILGLTLLITASDFGTIFLALELQSLSLYMLAGFKKNSIYSIESGLKYFILGALSAAYFLLGWSLLYGISGLFVLLSFHFFFLNVFSEVNSLLTFSTNFKITELFCCVSSKHFHTEKESFFFEYQVIQISTNQYLLDIWSVVEKYSFLTPYSPPEIPEGSCADYTQILEMLQNSLKVLRVMEAQELQNACSPEEKKKIRVMYEAAGEALKQLFYDAGFRHMKSSYLPKLYYWDTNFNRRITEKEVILLVNKVCAHMHQVHQVAVKDNNNSIITKRIFGVLLMLDYFLIYREDYETNPKLGNARAAQFFTYNPSAEPDAHRVQHCASLLSKYNERSLVLDFTLMFVGFMGLTILGVFVLIAIL